MELVRATGGDYEELFDVNFLLGTIESKGTNRDDLTPPCEDM